MPRHKEWEGTKFTWNIENFSCLKGESLLSPSFSSHSMTWGVRIIDEATNNISFELLLLKPTLYIFSFSFSLLDFDGTPLIWRERIRVSSSRCSRFYVDINKEVFHLTKAIFVPNDTLTVQCRIWRTPRGLLTPVSRFARTRIDSNVIVVNKTFTWAIADISSLEPFKFFERNEAISNGEFLTIKLSLNNDDEFEVMLTVSLFSIYVNIKILVLDSSGKKIEFANCEKKFEFKGQTWNFNMNVTKAMLMCYQNLFLPADILSLQFICTFSGNGIFNRMVDESEILANFPSTIAASSETPEMTVSADEHKSNQSNESHLPNTTSKALQDMYNEGFLSDFNLRVGDKVFPVHRCFLGARSQVFRAMFTTEMKEKEDKCVDIQDVDGDTLQRMLHFVYSDRLEEDMGWESASSLYVAADKYALEPLKQGCSSIVKSGLSISNVLEVLAMADMHQDQDLKSAALDFIALNDKEIVASELWIRFEKKNAHLAMETFRNLFSRKRTVNRSVGKGPNEDAYYY